MTAKPDFIFKQYKETYMLIEFLMTLCLEHDSVMLYKPFCTLLPRQLLCLSLRKQG